MQKTLTLVSISAIATSIASRRACIALEVQVTYRGLRRVVPRISHVYLHVLEHLAVLARNVRASRFVVHKHRHGLRLEHHLHAVLLVRFQCQQLGVAFPLSIVAVALLGVSIHHMKPASVRIEPQTRDATAVLTAVVAGRGEVQDVGPALLQFIIGSDVQADLVVQRDIHGFEFGVLLDHVVATEQLGFLGDRDCYVCVFNVDGSKQWL